MLEMDDHLQTINIEEQQTVAELVEELVEILLDDSRPEQTTRIGTHDILEGEPGRLCLEPRRHARD